MKYFSLIIAIIIFSSVSSCNKGGLPQPDSIIGKWRWVKSVGGIAGMTITPQKAGYTLTHEFKADSTIKILKNDSLITDARFSIIRNYKYGDNQKINVLKIADEHQMSFSIKNDTLFTFDIFISDGFGSTYVRIRD